MSSFQAQQAIAAQRAQAAEAKLAAERAARLRDEADKKARSDAESRRRAEAEREAIKLRDTRRREAEEAKRVQEQRKKERAEKAKQALEKEGDRSSGSARNGHDEIQARKFSKLTEKALARATNVGKSRGGVRPTKRRSKEDVDENGFFSGPSGSTLTREEKRARRERAMLKMESEGSRSRRGKASSSGTSRTSSGQGQHELVALGTVKRDHRSIDEIERDLMEAKRAKGMGSSTGKEHSSREAELALRRETAMNGKRQVAGSNATSTPLKSLMSSSKKETQVGNGYTPDRLRSTASVKNSLGLSPADYLPGAPIRADLLRKRPAAAKAKSGTVVVQQKKKRQMSSESSEDPSPKKPNRPETAREQFLREEQERKKQRAKAQAGSLRYEEEDSEGESEDESESDDTGDDDANRMDVREEIWKMFGRNRSEYVSRKVDSDDDDMEADLASVAREEARSARIAREEDLREELAQKKREQEKAARKAAASKASRK